MRSKSKSRKSRHLLPLIMIAVGFFSLLGSMVSGVNVVGPQLNPSTSTSYTATSVSTILTSSTTYSTTTSTTSSTTSTTTSSTSSIFSYTTTITSTTTSTSTYTSYTNTLTVPFTSSSSTLSTATSLSTTTSTVATTVLPSILPGACPVAQATSGTPLEPYANFLRGFRNNQIQNTTSGRDFMVAFNGWYYSWAPSVTYAAVANPWLLNSLRVGVYPLIGILYASYFAYAAVSPLSSEAGAMVAGVVAASLIGIVYVAPVAYVGLRLVRRRVRLLTPSKGWLLPSSGWFAGSLLMLSAAYVTGSAWLMGLGTANLTLSMLSVGSILGALGLNYVQLPFANLHALNFTVKRLVRYP